MKSVLIISTISFLCIFGGLFAWVQTQAPPAADEPGSALRGVDVDAAELQFQALEAERDALARQRAQLATRESELALREASISDQLEQVDAAIGGLQEERAAYESEREASTQKLANMFSSMKPASAAPIFATLRRSVALDILPLMKDKAAAKLLAELDPALAAELSTQMQTGNSR